MYRITATILKAGGLPVDWTRYSGKELTKEACEKMLSPRTEAGKSVEEKVTLENFRCCRSAKNG